MATLVHCLVFGSGHSDIVMWPSPGLHSLPASEQRHEASWRKQEMPVSCGPLLIPGRILQATSQLLVHPSWEKVGCARDREGESRKRVLPHVRDVLLQLPSLPQPSHKIHCVVFQDSLPDPTLSLGPAFQRFGSCTHGGATQLEDRLPAAQALQFVFMV